MNLSKKNILLYINITILIFSTSTLAAMRYNHSDLEWKTIETAHFKVNYHNGAENTAKRTARIAETIYEPVTSFYDFKPPKKTEIVIKDMDDYSNGGAYYYDNKILIWATPLNYILRGNHIWLRNVLTHEFSHIVSLGKSMKFSYNVPGIYMQGIGYEDEKREDVVRGYPNVIVSYPYPGVVMPMWLAEGVAQYNYPGSTNDIFDSHREMILRDRVLNNNLMGLAEMGSFGQKGTGRESVYNQGWAFTKYLKKTYGTSILPKLMDEMSEPFEVSVDNAIEEITGKEGQKVYRDWKQLLEKRFNNGTRTIRKNNVKGEVMFGKATSQLYPIVTEKKIYYLSNKNRAFLSQTSLYEYDRSTKNNKMLKHGISSKLVFGPNKNKIYYSKKGKPNQSGSRYYDIYSYNLEKEKEKEITKNARAMNPDISSQGKEMVYIINNDGTQNIVKYSFENEEKDTLTDFNNFEQIFNVTWGPEHDKIYFDITTNHARDIYTYNLDTDQIKPFLNKKYDERYPYFGRKKKWMYYSSDKTGIYNIYRKNLETGQVEILTNITGGAFMPYEGPNGGLYYTLYENSKFKIARIDNPEAITKKKTAYSDIYYKFNPDKMKLKKSVVKDTSDYENSYSRYFVMPRLMFDYGTLKPGFYFFSNEILNKMSLFGGAAVNKNLDYDLSLMAEYHGWEPTLFLEYYNIQRNVFNQESDNAIYPAEGDYRYNLKQAVIGLGKPVGNMNQLRLDLIASKYSTTVEQVTQTDYGEESHIDGFNYEYYNGVDLKLNWTFDAIMPQVYNVTNPKYGIKISTSLYRNYDNFLDTLTVSNDSGILVEKYIKNYYWKLKQEGEIHHTMPFYRSLAGSFKWRLGWISKPDINSFFNFFGGGMPGLKGYSFYSIEGRNLFTLHYTFRHPIFKQKNYDLGWFNLKNCFIGTFIETGNAWNGVEGYSGMSWSKFARNPFDVTEKVFGDFKSDIGVELNLSGFSFYAYPTSIQMDFAYGLNKFKVSDNLENTYTYDKEWRAYLKILFGL